MKVVLLALCVLLGACSGDAQSEARNEPTATPEADWACPNQEAVVEDVSLRAGSAQQGDVDGDGETDSVAVHYDPQGEPGCQAFAVAEMWYGTLSSPLPTWREDFGLPMPTLNDLAEVDGEPGEEIVVNMGTGASTQFVGIVVYDIGALRQVTTDVPGQTAPGMFGFGGSVGHMEAVDCVPGGGIIASMAVPDGNVYRVERTVYEFVGAELVREDREVERVPVQEIDRFPEYAASPFGSCRS